MPTKKEKTVVEKKVVVAMSGGVDSSVAAALLKEQGFDVIAIFMKFWSEDLEGQANKCCSSDAERRARKAASILGIPFYIVNAEKLFKKQVVDTFIKEYKKGNTPNPCVACNKVIKFKVLLQKALELKADLVATGHYVVQKKINKTDRLYIAKDQTKDQSYFLWQLSQRELRKTVFPLGRYKKTEVRKIAEKLKLPTAHTPESQEVCFIQTSTKEFLKHHLRIEPGKIVDNNGRILGEHQGLAFYTIGQRKGIGLSQGPHYVVNKDKDSNLLIVSKNKRDLRQKELVAEKVNWLSGEKPKFPLSIQAKIRYLHKAQPATVYENKKGECRIVFVRPQQAITPGQSVVFYWRGELLGGGVIRTQEAF